MMDIAEKVRLKRTSLFSTTTPVDAVPIENDDDHRRSAAKAIPGSADADATASTAGSTSSGEDALGSSIRSNSSSSTTATTSSTTAAPNNTDTATKSSNNNTAIATTKHIGAGSKNKNKNKTSNSNSNKPGVDDALVTTAQTLVDAAEPMINRLEEHPFLVSMVDGTLEEESFKYYVLQDALYLHELSECLEILARKAPTKDAATKLELFAANIRNCYREIHTLFLSHWEIDLPEEEKCGFLEDPGSAMPHTLMVTSSIRRVVTSEAYPVGLAAVLPCVWVHMGVVVRTLLRLRTNTDNKNNDDNNNDTKQEEQKQQERHPLCDAWIELYARRFKTDRGVAFLDSWCGFGMKMDVVDFAGMVDAACRRLQNHNNNAGENNNNNGSSSSSNLQTMRRDADASTLQRMQKIFVVGCRMEHMLLDQARTMLRWPDDDDGHCC